MSEQEITAEALDDYARGEGVLRRYLGESNFRRAARTIRRLEGEVAHWRDAAAARSEREGDAELGSLVRRIREHPELKGHLLMLSWSTALTNYVANAPTLTALVNDLDTLAQRRAADEGERAPSGRRFRSEADGSLSAQWDSNDPWSKAVRVDVVDVSFVAELLERVRKGVPRGE
jgi:hypothetical protein